MAVLHRLLAGGGASTNEVATREAAAELAATWDDAE